MIYYNDLLGAKYKPHGRGDGGYDCYGLVLECCRRAGTPLKDPFQKYEHLPRKVFHNHSSEVKYLKEAAMILKEVMGVS